MTRTAATGSRSPRPRCAGPPASPRRTCWSRPTRWRRSRPSGARCGTCRSETHGSDRFELRAAEALAAWRANQFELPDYYLVLAAETGPAAPAEDQRPDFYLGPLRSVRPHRVAVAAAAEPAEQAAAALSELGSLRAGRWWPSLEEIFRTVRGFYPGALAESPDAGRATLLA